MVVDIIVIGRPPHTAKLNGERYRGTARRANGQVAGNRHRQGSRQTPVIVPLNAALSLLSANEPGPLLPHSRGYTITTTVLAAFVAPVCILIALYFRVVFRFHHSATSHCRCGFELFIGCFNCC